MAISIKYIFFSLIILFSNIIKINSVIVPLDPQDQTNVLKTLNQIRASRIKKYEKEPSKNPKISIIIPVLDGQDYIKPIVTSIQTQTMEDIEIIFVEDFSKDNTYRNIINAQKLDPRIKVIKNKKIWELCIVECLGRLNPKENMLHFWIAMIYILNRIY